MNNILDVGTPPDDIDDWKTTVVRFHGFADLPTTRNESVESPEFPCFGHQWRLGLYPGGIPQSDAGYAAAMLTNESNKSIEVQFNYSVRDSEGKEVVYQPKTFEFGAADSEVGYNARCRPNFATRSQLIELLVQGTLIIEVRMKLADTNNSITQFIPTNPFNKNVLELLFDKETADIVFEVNNESLKSDEHTNKKSKTTTSIHAHRLILKNNASTLYEMCGASDGEGITTVSITDVTPKVFKRMIYYAYGGKLSDKVLKKYAKDIINACDKYGVVHLKLETEACYVESNEITVENMMDNLLYADSKNLALLKEAVMDYIVENKTSIIGKVSFNDFPSHLVTDLLTAVARGEEQTGDNADEDESAKYFKMRVGTLRKKLNDKGLDVDGSREAMIALLKEHDSDDDDDDDDDDNGEDGVGE